eukprot:TRINITY_DN112483_c0_g1_i1.p2 TRINITY_DN112483_c0_g1~~TRINITY_DN112483_c0_g1_i1.p2  ORF type:complete len:491 (+),score=-32.30 TRINITY_DN112483_c0_g1_i1:75-1475(+)
MADKLIAAGASASANALHEQGVTALMFAVMHGRLDLVRTIMRCQGCKPDLASPTRVTALCIACEHDPADTAYPQAEMISALAAGGASMNVMYNNKHPLIHAIQARRLGVITALTQAGADVSVLSSAGGSVLEHACRVYQDGDAAEMRAVLAVLLAAGADKHINIQNKSGQTALMHAVASRSRDAVSALLDAGADATLRDGDGNNVLAYLRSAETLPLLLDAAAQRCPEESGADTYLDFINNSSATGETALARALTRKHNSVASALVHAGADVTITDAEGQSPLMKTKDADMLRLLLDAGGDAIINHSDIRGATALMLAICSRAEVATLAMLISAGADVNAADLHGRTALMCLCHDPSPTLARLHVRVRRHGNTPTEIAHNAKIDQQIDDDYERFCATLALLLDAGADATARDDADMTVVMLASLRSEERSPTVSPAMMAALVLAVEARMEPELEGEPVGGAVGIPT